MVERLFLAVPRGCLQFVIVVFPDHTHLLLLFQAATSQSGKQLHVPRLYIILLGFSNSQLIGSHTMKRVCLKLKRDVLESQMNKFVVFIHLCLHVCLCQH